MNSNELLKIVQKYSRKSEPEDGDTQVTRIPDRKTVFIEQIGGEGRSVLMSEFKVDGATYWAGYSLSSQMVYISLAA